MKAMLSVSIAVFTLSLLSAQAAMARDGIEVNPYAARRFATMPPIANYPEGIAVNPYNGDVFVGTFEFDTSGTETNGVVRFDRYGRLIAKSDFTSNIPLLGLAFNPRDHSVYITSVGNFQGVSSGIKRLAANFREGAVLEDVAIIPNIGAPPKRKVDNPDGSHDIIKFGDNAAVPNAIAFNKFGEMFVTDSFQAAIFVIEDPGHCYGKCTAEVVVHDGLLATAGFPPFGANGIAFRANSMSPIYVANTGDDRVLTYDLYTKEFAVLAESINGADGIAFDDDGKLWIAANQADNVVSIDGNGRLADVLGAFLGIKRDGSVRGLIFPASIAITHGHILVTNAALPLDGSPDNEWEEEITRYTISRISLPRRHDKH